MRHFRFHLATLLLASLSASAVIYLNLAHRKDPRIQAQFYAAVKVRYSMFANKGCVRTSEHYSGRYLIRCYVEDPGWPFSLWPTVLSTYSIATGEAPTDEKLLITDAEWKAHDFQISEDLFLFEIYRDEAIFTKAPQFAERLFIPKEPVVMRSPEINVLALTGNIGIALVLILLPAALIEALSRRKTAAAVLLPIPQT